MVLSVITELKWVLGFESKNEFFSGYYRQRCFEAIKADNLEQAQELIDESVKYNDNHFKNWFLLARIAEKQDCWDKAKEHIATAAEKLGPDPAAKDMAFFKEQHGILLALMDELPQAIELLRQAQKVDHCDKRDELIRKLETHLFCDDDSGSF